MFTKSELCWFVIRNEMETLQISSLNELRKKIYQSSSAAVALQELGLLEENRENEYADSRGGVIFCGNVSAIGKDKKIKTLSLRDIIKLLPD